MLGRARVVVAGFVLAWATLGAEGCAKSDNGVGFGGAAATGGYSALGGAPGGGFAGSGGQAGAGGFAGQASGGASGSASGGASGNTGTGGATGGTGGATGGTGGATGGTGGATGGTGGATGGTGGATGGTGGTTSGTAWINELHYDNASTDANEGVEIAGTAGLNLTNWSLVFYNGNTLTKYMTTSLTGSIPNQQNAFGTVWFPVSGIQNGGADGTTTSPDGVALVDATNKVVQFLSYEGAFTPTDGPASGIASIDIGKAELSTSPVGDSLQLVGSGKTYASFSWADSMAATPGQPNTGQSF